MIFWIFYSDSVSHSENVPRMNITDLYTTCEIDAGPTVSSIVTRLNSLGLLVTLLWQMLASNPQWKSPLFQSFCSAHSAQSLALPRSKALPHQTPSTCSQLVHSVAIYARLSYEPSLHLPCCSPRRFQSAVTLIALPWQISHSCQEDTLWLLMTIREKMGIRRKGSARGEMRGARGGLGSGSLVKLGRVEGGKEGGRRGEGGLEEWKRKKSDMWRKWGAGGKEQQIANN